MRSSHQEKRGSQPVEKSQPNRSYNSANPDTSFMNDEYETISDYHVGLKPVPFKKLWDELDTIPWRKLKYTSLPPITSEISPKRKTGRGRIGSIPEFSATMLRRKKRAKGKRPKNRKLNKNTEGKGPNIFKSLSTIGRSKKRNNKRDASKNVRSYNKQRTLNEIEDVSDQEYEEDEIKPIFIKPEIVAPRNSILPVKSIGNIPPPMLKNSKPEVKVPPSYVRNNMKRAQSRLANNPQNNRMKGAPAPGRVSLANIQLRDKNNNSSQSMKKLKRKQLAGVNKSVDSFNSSGGRVSLIGVRLVEGVKDSESVTVTESVVSENRTVYEEDIPEDIDV